MCLIYRLVLGWSILAAIGTCSRYEDEDTITIEASREVDEVHSRSKRQSMLMYPYPSHYIQQQTPAQYMPQQPPAQYMPQQTPAQYMPQQPPAQYMPQQTIPQYMPLQPPAQYMPQQTPPQYMPQPQGSCVTKSGFQGQCFSVGQCYPHIRIQSQAAMNLLLSTASLCGDTSSNVIYGRLFYQSQPTLVCCPTAPSPAGSRPWKNSDPGTLRSLMPPNVSPVSIEKYPWTVAIMRGDKHHCGGSLISKFTVVTAAHCIFMLSPYDVSNLRVLLGHHDISQNARTQAVTRKVMKIVFHKEFSMQTLHNDIGFLILEFSAPLEGNVKISPVTLGRDLEVQGKAMIAGWGQMGWNLPPTPNLMETTIDIWSNRKCAAMYGPLAPGGITSKMICGSAVGKDACRGDSGGPLMSQKGNGYEQIGIVSWGIECGKYPSVHTRLSSFSTWIQKNRLD